MADTIFPIGEQSGENEKISFCKIKKEKVNQDGGNYYKKSIFSFGKTAIPPSILVRTQNPKSRTKIRVAALVSRHSPKKAKIQEEPWKITRISEMKKNWSGSNGKIVALDVLVICVVDKKLQSQKILFAPSVKIFGVKI